MTSSKRQHWRRNTATYIEVLLRLRWVLFQVITTVAPVFYGTRVDIC